MSKAICCAIFCPKHPLHNEPFTGVDRDNPVKTQGREVSCFNPSDMELLEIHEAYADSNELVQLVYQDGFVGADVVVKAPFLQCDDEDYEELPLAPVRAS